MPMFTRRRLQAMLDESDSFLSEQKRRNLVVKLRSGESFEVLSAEGELAMVWAISRLGPIEYEPERWGEKHPDIISGSLFKGEDAAIEIKCVSDGPIAGEEAMRRAVKKMTDYADQVSSGIGRHLHFVFAEESSYSPSGYRRRRKVANDFDLDDAARTAISRLVEHTGDTAIERLQNSKIDVVIRKSPEKVIGTNYFCTMPPEFHCIDRNTVSEALKKAKRQLRNNQFTGKRIAILIDAGCVLLQRLHDFDASDRRVSGQQVIRNFLSRIYGTVDGGMEVAVLSASKGNMKQSRGLEWQLTVFDSNGNTTDAGHPLHAAINHLPTARLKGYQARQQINDGVLQDRKFRIFRSSSTTCFQGPEKGKFKLKISSRILIEFLARNISESDFRRGISMDKNSHVSNFLNRGLMPSNITLEAGGLDKDDDYIVFEFASDPSVSPLK